jgi:hypothetical protein
MMFIYVIAVYVSSDPGTYIVRIRFAFQNRVWHQLHRLVLWNWYISRARGYERPKELHWLEIHWSEMFGLQVMTRMMVLIMIMVMVSGILSVWKEYFWVNNLG